MRFVLVFAVAMLMMALGVVMTAGPPTTTTASHLETFTIAIDRPTALIENAVLDANLHDVGMIVTNTITRSGEESVVMGLEASTGPPIETAFLSSDLLDDYSMTYRATSTEGQFSLGDYAAPPPS